MELLKTIKNNSRPHVKQFRRFWVSQKKRLTNFEQERKRSLNFFSKYFQIDAKKIYSEHLNSGFRHWYNTRLTQLYKLVGTASISSTFDMETLYLLVRLSKPEVIVETGVLYGASSSFILEAIQENGSGKLYSIDLPSKDNVPPKDFLVREPVRKNWELIVGDSKEELPRLLNRLKSISHFHHDSLHVFSHMFWEYKTAFDYLIPSGILSSHDVITAPFDRNAFKEFCKEKHKKYGIFLNTGFTLQACGNKLKK